MCKWKVLSIIPPIQVSFGANAMLAAPWGERLATAVSALLQRLQGGEKSAAEEPSGDLEVRKVTNTTWLES